MQGSVRFCVRFVERVRHAVRSHGFRYNVIHYSRCSMQRPRLALPPGLATMLRNPAGLLDALAPICF